MDGGKFPIVRPKAAAVVIAALLLSVSTLGQTKFKVLYSFKGGTDAAAPTAAPIFDASGNLYGTAGGGTSYGTVYKLTRHPDDSWTETILHRWNGFGETIWGGLVSDSHGNMYGTAVGLYGPLFELIPDTGHVKQYALPDGGSDAALLIDATGRLFGPGAAGCCGGIFGLTRTAEGWKQEIVYTFQAGAEGFRPVGTLARDAKTNLYGATQSGGIYPPMCGSGGDGCGTIYQLTRGADGKWKEHILHRFAQFENDGELPMAGLVMDSQGSLYGTTFQGGAYQTGTLFKLTRGSNGQWRETVLFDFPKNEDGGGPIAPMVFDRAGNLYGTTVGGGTQASYGVVFKLSPGSGRKWVYSVLHRFSGPDGGHPYAGVTLDGKGNLYGTTFWGGKYLYGVVYEITP